MSTRISRQHVFYAFSPELQPALTIRQGEEVLMETHDCFEGQLRSQHDLVTDLDWEHINPATGPVYIQGVRAGDVVRVDLLEVKVASTATMVAIPQEGALGDMIETMETVVLRLEGDEVVYKDMARIPARPMVGVIGMAPASGKAPNGTPGAHGGNMDCALIGQGASVYFTAAVDGGLFGAGDMHAAMGDGEIVVCGAETAGELRFRAEVVDLPGLPTPFVETDALVATIYSAKTADEAAHGAIHNMARFLTDLAGLPLNDAAMLMSLVGELKFCQVVDPEKTVRFEFPKQVLAGRLPFKR
ncbi:MAG: acetamidase/formamidase family protein [Anaerolineaceae bacterium]|jgi:amidase